MDDHTILQYPLAWSGIRTDTEKIGFTMASEHQTGSLLRTLAASKPGGRLLELGTGTGVGTAWLLAGMDADARLISVDVNPDVQAIAVRHLGADPRVTFETGDGAAFLERAGRDRFDLIYADAWPGKFSHLDAALDALRAGGIYIVDDLLPQPNWPDGHAANIPVFIDRIESRADLVATRLAWASGLMIVVRRAA